MIKSIKDVINEYGISGDILLYRDADHRKKKMCEYLVSNIDIGDKEVHTYSDGAFALYLARALPNNLVNTYCGVISHDYGEIMEATENLKINLNTSYPDFDKTKFDGIKIDQYSSKLVFEYYKSYFQKMVDEVKDYKINAFCDCGHSCATLAGFVASNLENKLVDWNFILGCVLKVPRTYIYHLESYRDKIISYLTTKFDTYEIGDKIEEKHPDFGNVFEATRSISAAMAYLQEHPNETVAVYVGDSFIKEGSRFKIGRAHV